jgi:hypothetical protein
MSSVAARRATAPYTRTRAKGATVASHRAATMSDSEPSALMLKKGRGRPRKDGSVRPAKVVKGCSGQVVLQQYHDDRKRASKEWVEVAPRPIGRGLSAEEKLSFLRCVASIRRMAYENSLTVRSSSGLFETAEPVKLAAQLMGISEVTAKRVHSQFQESKILPDDSERGSYSHAFVIEELFGQRYLESWTRIVVQRCIAVKKRPSYRDITAGLQELAVEHARDEASLIEPADEVFLESIKDALTYQRVRRWCRRNKWLFKKVVKVKGVVSDNSQTTLLCTRYCQRFLGLSADSVAIYLDESYCNEKHAQRFAVCKIDDQSTWSDEIKDGRRLCFCDAISEKGEISVLDRNRPDGEPDSRWMFSPNKDQMAKKDYHASFDSKNFLDYFKNALVPACERVFPQKKLVFIMDNASYHVSSSFEIQGDQPGSSVNVHKQSNKKSLVQFLQAHRGQNAANIGMLRLELEALFVEVTEELGCDAARYLRSRGHDLLLTPPRVSIWQPIELYWASCKNEVAKLYRQGRGLVETTKQLNASLTKYGTAEHCSKLIAHTTKLVRTWWEQVQRADAQAADVPDIVEINSERSVSDDADDMSHSDDHHSGADD